MYLAFKISIIFYGRNVGGFPIALFLLSRCMECRRGLAMRILSVRPSVKRVICDKIEERSVQIFIPHETSV